MAKILGVLLMTLSVSLFWGCESCEPGIVSVNQEVSYHPELRIDSEYFHESYLVTTKLVILWKDRYDLYGNLRDIRQVISRRSVRCTVSDVDSVQGVEHAKMVKSISKFKKGQLKDIDLVYP